MKINQTTKNALSTAKAQFAGKPAIKAKPTTKQKQVAKAVNGKPAKVKAAPLPIVATGRSVALVSGKRGLASRLVDTAKQGENVLVRALQDNKGLPITGDWLVLGKDGVLTGEKKARIEMGCYVNGRNTGAKCELMTEGSFNHKAKVGMVNWNIDGDAKTAGMYIGNPAQKGMIAVRVVYSGKPFFWQCEQDSNVHNKHERGQTTPGKQTKGATKAQPVKTQLAVIPA